MKSNRVLGKGLSALIPGADEPLTRGSQAVATVPIAQIGCDPQQPRKMFDEDKLAELAASIEEVGVLQPVLIRRLRPGEGARRHPGAADGGPLLIRRRVRRHRTPAPGDRKSRARSSARNL